MAPKKGQSSDILQRQKRGICYLERVCAQVDAESRQREIK